VSRSAGDDLVQALATPARAKSVVSDLLGPTLDFGPVPAGPGGMATATAHGRVGRLSAESTAATHVRVTVPVRLDLAVVVGRREIPVDVTLSVRIGLGACLAPGADEVVVEVDELGPGDIDVDTRASGVGGVIVRRLGDIDNEIRHHVIHYVTELLARPEAVAARHIPVDAESESA
jgi:hypothetical protein